MIINNNIPTIEVFALRIPEQINKNDFEFLLGLISHSKKERILRFRNKEDAYRALLADILVRWYVSCIKKCLPIDVEFYYNEFGKPFIPNKNNPIEFNISHSGAWVVAAFHNNSVGIDIEKIKPININEIGERFFSALEYQTLTRSNSNLEEFYRIWCLKESYIKSLGCGLNKQLHSFSIVQVGKSYYSVIDESEVETFYLKEFHLEESYKCALCVKDKIFKENIHMINYSFLYKNLQYNINNCSF